MIVRTKKNEVAYVDDDMAALVSSYTWWTDWKGYFISEDKKGGIRKIIRLHRLVMDNPDGQVDHINGDVSDCRRENLRILPTGGLNQANMKIKKNNTSGFKGVSLMPGYKYKIWRARVANKTVGYYETKIEAAKAYNKAALELYGEYARLNKIGAER